MAWGPLARQAGFGILIAMILVAGAAYVLQEPIETASEAFVARTGLLGVFLAVLLIDTFHLTHEPILLAAYVGGIAFWPMVVVASAASILSGPVGWWIGGHVGRVGVVKAFLSRHRLDAFLRRYGLAAVAIAALTPVPFAATVWAAGATGVRFRDVLLGSLLRFPKVLFWAWIVVSGWSIGTGWGA